MHNGYERAAIQKLRPAENMKELHRVILGTDAPAGLGVQPPGIGMVVIDGQIRCQRSRNTPPATRIPTIIEG